MAQNTTLCKNETAPEPLAFFSRFVGRHLRYADHGGVQSERYGSGRVKTEHGKRALPLWRRLLAPTVPVLAKWVAVWSVLATLEAQAALAPVIDYVAPSPAPASEHIPEQIVDVPAPQIMGKIVVPAPQLQEEIAEVIQPIPPERISEHIVEQIVAESPGEAEADVPGPDPEE